MGKLFLIFVLAIPLFSFAQIKDFSTINFNKADDIASNYKVEKLTNLPKLAYDLTNKLTTPVEKFRAIYTWVSLNIDSDYYYQEKIMRVRKKLAKDSLALNLWNRKNQAKFFKKLANQKETICTGYAYLVKELAYFAEIDCKIIDGYGRNAGLDIKKIGVPNHSWNAVYLNKKWYLCDPTWSSGYSHVTSKKATFIHKYNDGYFLADPKLFIKNHYPLNKKWALFENSIAIEDFIKAPFIYGETFKHQVIPIEPKELVTTIKKGQFVNFKFKTSNKIDIKKVSLEFFDGNSKELIKPIFMLNNTTNLDFKHKFEKKGLFDIHIKIDTDIVSTFTIKVKK